MLTFALIVAGIISILLMLVVLIQNPKGGGLASNFSAGNQIFGAGKTSDLVEKLTWGFAIAIIVISLYASSYNAVNMEDIQTSEGRTDIENLLENSPATGSPVAPPPSSNENTPPPTNSNDEGVQGGSIEDANELNQEQ